LVSFINALGLGLGMFLDFIPFFFGDFDFVMGVDVDGLIGPSFNALFNSLLSTRAFCFNLAEIFVFFGAPGVRLFIL